MLEEEAVSLFDDATPRAIENERKAARLWLPEASLPVFSLSPPGAPALGNRCRPSVTRVRFLLVATAGRGRTALRGTHPSSFTSLLAHGTPDGSKN